MLAGGQARSDLGPFFYEPTILTKVTPDMKLYADETFGPVVAVYPVTSEAEAVERANDTPLRPQFQRLGRGTRRAAERWHAGSRRGR